MLKLFSEEIEHYFKYDYVETLKQESDEPWCNKIYLCSDPKNDIFSEVI